MNGFNGAFEFAQGISLRFAKAEDQTFLFKLFIETRPWLSWAQGDTDFIRSLYEQQYKIMRTGMETVYPEHLDFIIERLDYPVGRLSVDLGYTDWCINEIQILKQARGVGIATNVIKGLQVVAERGVMPLTLSTPMLGSNARPIYERLGFHVTQIRPPIVHMAWLPSRHPDRQKMALHG